MPKAKTPKSLDFLPPGYVERELPEPPPPYKGPLCTYFLSADKRGLSRYAENTVDSYRSGFRALLVGPPGMVFNDKSAVLVGQQSGNTLREGKAWADSDPVTELETEYLTGAAGTPAQQSRCLRQLERAMTALQAHEARRVVLEDKLQAVARETVTRFGREVLHLNGAMYGPSHTRERVYYKRRWDQTGAELPAEEQ